jgi:FAD/FMN-containing dehydrogenase
MAYPQDKLLFNTPFDGSHPRAIVYCEFPEDVEKTVRWARRHAIRIVPRSGGHSYGGYSTTSAGVVVDVTRMRTVHLKRRHGDSR